MDAKACNRLTLSDHQSDSRIHHSIPRSRAWLDEIYLLMELLDSEDTIAAATPMKTEGQARYKNLAWNVRSEPRVTQGWVVTLRNISFDGTGEHTDGSDLEKAVIDFFSGICSFPMSSHVSCSWLEGLDKNLLGFCQTFC